MKRVLILDDDSSLREILKLGLTTMRSDVACETVGTVPELRDHFRRIAPEKPSIVFLDINLGPGLETGLDAYQWLQSQRYEGTIAFLTGHARENPTVQDACALSNVHVLEKPVPFAKLTALVEASR